MIMILMATTALSVLLSILSIFITSLRTVVNWLFTKISILVPAMVALAVTYNFTRSLALSGIACIATGIIFTLLLRNQTLKTTADLCSGGFLTCVAFYALKEDAKYLYTTEFFTYILAFLVIWALLTTANIKSGESSGIYTSNPSAMLLTVIFVISTLYSYFIIGINGIYKLKIVENLDYNVKMYIGIGISCFTALLMTLLYRKLLTTSSDKISYDNAMSFADYQTKKIEMSNIKMSVDYCMARAEYLNEDDRKRVGSIQSIFYRYCSDFQKNQFISKECQENIDLIKEEIDRFIAKIDMAENAEYFNEEVKPQSSDIEKALAIFMFDSLDEVTEEALKKQRNKLIKVYHSDSGEENEKYAQKINSAYELIKTVI